jgi:hypothetical protein
MLSRRLFLRASALPMLLQVSLRGESPDAIPQVQTTRPNLLLIDRVRILARAQQALERPISEDRRVDGDAFLAFTLDLPALAAACLINRNEAPTYLLKARALLDVWFLSGQTRLSPTPALGTFEALTPRSALAEVAVALPALDLPSEDLEGLRAWFRATLVWMNSDRTALLARDARNHHASSWLLQASAFAKFLSDDAVLSEQRHRFKKEVLRAQVNAEGFFRNDLEDANPFRASLYNLDLLAGSAMLLSTQFDSLWTYELPDGPGLRAAIARHAAFIAAPATWPYPADAQYFADLPGRRPALLFAGRAYAEADYVALWSRLNPDPKQPAILSTFPIRQPILWVQPRSAS